MALVFTDLTKETTSTTGTGTLTLTGAVAKYQSFANIGTGNTTYYRIESGNDSEVGLGTYNGTLSRDTVYMSIIAGVAGTTKITVADGATVSCVYPAERAVYLDAVGNLGVGGTSTVNKLTVADTTLATGSAAGSLVDLSQTWNNAAGNPTAIKLNVTNTASGATAKLMDLQVGGSSKFSATKNGTLTCGTVNSNETSTNYAKTFLFNTDGNDRFGFVDGTAVVIGQSSFYAFSQYNSIPTTVANLATQSDVKLYRDGTFGTLDGKLALRNGVNAQTFRLYNTYTSVSDYSRLTFTTNANNHQVASEAAGTGSIKPIVKSVYTSASDPTTTNIPDGFSCVWRNSTLSEVRHWTNVGGTLFKSAAFT